MHYIRQFRSVTHTWFFVFSCLKEMGALPPTGAGLENVFVYVTMAQFAYIPFGQESFQHSIMTENEFMLTTRALNRTEWVFLDSKHYEYSTILCKEGHISGHKNEFDHCGHDYAGSYFLPNTAMSICHCHFNSPGVLKDAVRRLVANELFLRSEIVLHAQATSIVSSSNVQNMTQHIAPEMYKSVDGRHGH